MLVKPYLLFCFVASVVFISNAGVVYPPPATANKVVRLCWLWSAAALLGLSLSSLVVLVSQRESGRESNRGLCRQLAADLFTVDLPRILGSAGVAFGILFLLGARFQLFEWCVLLCDILFIISAWWLQVHRGNPCAGLHACVAGGTSGVLCPSNRQNGFWLGFGAFRRQLRV